MRGPPVDVVGPGGPPRLPDVAGGRPARGAAVRDARPAACLPVQGRLSWALSAVHGLLYAVDVPLYSGSGGAGFWAGAAWELVPTNSYSPDCLRWAAPWEFLASDDDDDGGGRCYKPWRNVTGIASLFFLFLLGVTSFDRIRRRRYRVFLVCHVVFGSLMLLFAVLHFYWIGLYLVSGILHYLCCTLPAVSGQLFAGALGDSGGVIVTDAVPIPGSNGCFELRLLASLPHGEGAGIRYPAYIRIGVPEVSGKGAAGRLIWHPFTVASPVSALRRRGRPEEELRLLIRATGPFTNGLHGLVRSDRERAAPSGAGWRPSYTVHVDALHCGADWISETYRHDPSLLVAGGIGITPVLSVLLEMLRRAMDPGGVPSRPGRDVMVHWYCRDRALAEYVLANYLEPVLRQGFRGTEFGEEGSLDGEEGGIGGGDRIRLSIHLTSSLATQGRGENDAVGSPWTAKEDEKESVASSSDRGNTGEGDSQDSQRGVGHPFRGTTDGLRRLVAGMLVGTNLLHLLYYNLAVWEYRDRIFFRGYILYAAIFIVAAGTLLWEARRKRGRYSRRHLVPSVADECDENSGGDAHFDTEWREGTPSDPLHVIAGGVLRRRCWEARNGRCEFSAEVLAGRPVLEDVIRPAVVGARPAVFFCGPDSLWESVSRSIRRGRKSGFRSGALAAAHCSFFKERFEL